MCLGLLGFDMEYFINRRLSICLNNAVFAPREIRALIEIRSLAREYILFRRMNKKKHR